MDHVTQCYANHAFYENCNIGNQPFRVRRYIYLSIVATSRVSFEERTPLSRFADVPK